MTLDEKRQYAKDELGLTQAYNMSEATLDKKIADIEASEEPKVKFELGKNGVAVLDFMGVDPEFMSKVVDANGFDRVEYSKLRKHFACIKNNKKIGTLTIDQVLEMWRKNK